MLQRVGKWRWLIVFLSVFLQLASHYCTQVPAAIYDSFRSKFHELSEGQYEYFYNTLFTIYSIPNIILPFINGYLIDRIGLRVMLFSLMFITTMGQIIFVNGAIQGYIFETLLGRLIYGAGSESLTVVNNILMTKYFQGQELSFAITINIAGANLGCVINMFLTPRSEAKYGFNSTIWMGPYFCLFALVCALCLICIDSRRSGIDRSSLVKRLFDYGNGEVSFKEVFSFDKIFWYLCFTSLFLYSSILCWTNVVAGYIIDEMYSQYDENTAQIVAGTFASCIWLSAAISGPIFGRLADQSGARTRILLISCCMCIVSLLLFFQPYPIIPSVMLGLSYALGSASIFPSISYLVPAGVLGKANGIITSGQNLGFSLVPYVIAILKVTFGSYEIAILALVGFATISLRFAWLTYKENLRKGYKLEVDAELIDEHGRELLEIQFESRKSSGSRYNLINRSDRLNFTGQIL